MNKCLLVLAGGMILAGAMLMGCSKVEKAEAVDIGMEIQGESGQESKIEEGRRKEEDQSKQEDKEKTEEKENRSKVQDQSSMEEKKTQAVNAAYAEEEQLAQKDAYDQFIADRSEFQVKVLFTAQCTVTDFQFCVVNFEDISEEGEAVFSISQVLYEQEKLTPEKPLVIGMTFPGDMPTSGITYKDEDGVRHFYSLCQSGFDGSLIMTEEQYIL